ncbi:MAG TPA: EamA family transporter [Gemmatimonadales bacterium]|nr:EamA family transporter [Gemmatimonadales bacterium]
MSTRASRAAVFWSFAAIYILWGSTYLAIRVMVTAFPPFLAAGSRFLVAGGILYGWARWRGVAAPALRLWAYAALIGGLFFLLGNGGVSWAETRLPSGLTALLAATSPLFTAVFTSARGGWRRPAAPVIVGIFAGLGGVALLVAPGEFIGGEHADLAGAAAITLAALAWAAGSVTSHARPLHPSPELATGMKMLAGGVLLLLTGLLGGEGARIAPEIFTPKVLLAWVYLVVFGSLIGFSAFTYLLRVTTPQKVSTSAFVNPLVAVGLGWLLLDESITPRTLLAAAIIIGAVVLIRVRSEEPQEP